MEGQALPTAANLAESFLETEPQEEKEELQAAISSQSHVFHRSSSSNEDEEEEELGLGNETMSLPSFLAGFLKSVVDQLQLKIKDVSVRIDMELKQDGTSKRQPEEKPDLIAGLLSVREIDVHGISRLTAGPEEPLPHRQTKRLVSLADINFGLVSDPVVFANYSRFTAPASPTTTMQSKESQSSSRAFSPPPLAHSGSEHDMAMSQSTIFEPSIRFDHGSVDRGNINDHAMAASAISHDGRFSDADSEAEHLHDSYLNDSRVFGGDNPFHDNPGYLDSVIESHSDEFDVQPRPVIQSQEKHMTSSVASFDNYSHFPPATWYEAEQKDAEVDEREPGLLASYHGPQAYSVSQASQVGLEAGTPSELLRHAEEPESDSKSSLNASQHHLRSTAPSDAGSTHSETSTAEPDLTESKYFSHDEAQSLYMSAISQGPGESFLPNMPGAWDSSDSGEKGEHVSETTTPTDQTRPGEEIPDEAAVSTPKFKGPSGSYFGEQPPDDDDQANSRSASTDKASMTSSHILHKTTEIRKSVLSIDRIFIWLPSASEEETPDHASPQVPSETTGSDPKESSFGLRESVVEESMFASKAYASTHLHRSSAGASGSPQDQQQHDGPHQPPRLEVEVFAVIIHFDIATGWLLTKACQKIAHTVDQSEKGPSQSKSSSNQSSSPIAFDLAVHSFSIKFLEHVAGHTSSPGNVDTSFPPYSSMEEVVLQVTTSGLKAHVFTTETKTTLNLDISKFALGFSSHDLISFDESLKMRESTRDITASSQGDISLSLTKSAESAKADVSTLPLRLDLNIQRLEEVLGWMGGLSTILELGNSISSASTMKGAHKPQQKRPRGVHFETPAPVSDKDRSNSTPWKVNARVGGIVLDVVGETHYLQLTTTAVKVVSRFEGIGVQVDKAGLTGPLPFDDYSEAPAIVTMNNIRIEFLFSPKEVDLDRLLTLITPSQDKYDDEDDIMLDTLLRQRRQGSVLRTTVAGMKVAISDTSALAPLSSLGVELGRLSNVTKYLPEDDRPGILTLTLVREFDLQVHLGGQVGNINANLVNAEAAWISMPSLIATQIGTMAINRNTEELVGEALSPSKQQTAIQPLPPVVMARFIPDEMDPTFKIKLHHLRFEYTIPSIMAFLGLGQDTTGGEFANEMAQSIANLAQNSTTAAENPSFSPPRSDTSKPPTKPIKIAVVFRDCVLGLNPRKCPSKGLVVLTNSKFNGIMHGDESSEATLNIRKASIMVIDDVRNEGNTDNLNQRPLAGAQGNQVQTYIDKGYVPVSSISSAKVVVKMISLAGDGTKFLDVELRDNLLILETCADSTQTLISILNGLQPPTPPSATAKYRTEVMPIQDMLASFTGDAFAADPALALDRDSGIDDEFAQDSLDDQLSDELEYVSDFRPGKQEGFRNDEDIDMLEPADRPDLLSSFHSEYQVSSSITELNFEEDHFAKKSAVGGTAHRWNSAHNTYDLSNDSKLDRSPLRLRVRDFHVIWNLFDGYDWQRTRDTISMAVHDVEAKATERRARASPMSPDADSEEESVIGDFLFNSIYIGIPANKDPRELRREINQEINDLTSETGSYATTTTVTGATSRQGRSGSRKEKKLRLDRSKHHKMTFELKGVCADLVVFPPGSGETQSSLDVRVRDLEIFDHLPTSTWKKFAAYMAESGERESGTSMVHLEILTVKPIPELAASEIVLKVNPIIQLSWTAFLTEILGYGLTPPPDCRSRCVGLHEPVL